nr:MAG: capsid protein [Cressdnaviricota sp.]
MPYSDKQKIAYYKRLAGQQIITLKGKGSYKASAARYKYGALKGKGAYTFPNKSVNGYTYLGKTSRTSPRDTQRSIPLSRSVYNDPMPGSGPRNSGGYYNSRFVRFGRKYVPKGTFGAIGGGLGSLVGMPTLGAAAGMGLSKLIGFGSYKISKNSLTLGEGTGPPKMHSTSTGLKIRHCEYITDIVSSGTANTFKLQSFPIQPGLVQSFPWLSPIAQQYEEYRPLGIVFEFKSLSSTAIASSTNTTMGGVIMATDYNSINAPFVNKQQMDNTQYTTSTAIYNSFFHPIECKSTSGPISTFYIRGGAAPAGTDIRMYDLGLFQIASFGVQGTNVVLGELWATYEFELKKPISTSALGQDVLSDHFQLTGITALANLGTTTGAPTSGSSIGGTITGTGTIYNFPPVYQEGTYMFVWTIRGTGVPVTNPTITLANCVAEEVFLGDTITFQGFCANGTTSTIQGFTGVITITASNATLTWSGGTPPGSPTGGDLLITQFDSNIVS